MTPQTVLITGCTPGGAGNAIAKEFKNGGYRVIATGRTVEKIAELKDDGIECVAVELTDSASIEACHEEVKKLLGDQGLDFLINNAGIVHFSPAAETPLEDAKKVFEVNLFAAVQMNSIFLPELRRAKGTIINVGSLASSMPLPLHSFYGASKAALYSYTDVLRQELKPLGVTARYLYMGSVATTIVRDDKLLPEDSTFAVYNSKALPLAQKFSRDGMTPDAYAKELVPKIIRGQSWWRNDWELYAADASTIMWSMIRFATFWPWDLQGFLWSFLFGLNKLDMDAASDKKQQ